MRKILFLDVDGVCNSAQFAYTTNARGVLGIDPYPAFLVGKIQLDTGCEVVLSSTWRLWKEGREDVRKQVVEFIDVTPELPSRIRGEEIEKWLKDNNAEDAVYAILDDDMDMLAYQAPNFFLTTWRDGLTPEIAKAVTEHLNK
jgi:hypothetical protein